MLLLVVGCIFAIYFLSIFNVAAYGKSVEDLVGVFSIQKTIKLGSSNECFGNQKESSDPLSYQNMVMTDQPPILAAFGIEPRTVKASSPQSINLTARIIDDQGILSNASNSNSSTAWFVSPTGNQTASATFDPLNPIAGNKQDRIYLGKIALPEKSEIGKWHLDNLTLVDGLGNRRIYDNDQMLRLGFPVEFLVI